MRKLIIGIVGSGNIGPDMVYAFASALGGGGRIILHDIDPDALTKGVARIRAYARKGLSRGKLSEKRFQGIMNAIIVVKDISALSDCTFVLEAATEDLSVHRKILAGLEEVVSPDCMIGFATSGIPIHVIAEGAKYPERCVLAHPFYPSWRSLPIEVCGSDDAWTGKIHDLMIKLGKVPIVVKDVPCFAADDVFCNYIAEAVRLVQEGIATPVQVDSIINDTIGGGGPFAVMNLTRGNLLVDHCQRLMQEHHGNAWFAPPELLSQQGDTPWELGDASYTEETVRIVMDRILAVLFTRTLYVLEQRICGPTEMNWLTRMALGFKTGLVSMVNETGIEPVRKLCEKYRTVLPMPESLRNGRVITLYRDVRVSSPDGDGIVTVEVFRPPVNPLSSHTHLELSNILCRLDEDPDVKGVVLTGFNGALAGADIGELAGVQTREEGESICKPGQNLGLRIEAMSKPVVAAVNGPTLGGGAELALACWARVAGPHAVIGFPESNLGFITGNGGSQRLPRLIGLKPAVEMLRTARLITAQEACQLGWALGQPEDNPVKAAKALIRLHVAGEMALKPLDPGPMKLPGELPEADIGHRSTAIDAILVGVLREGLTLCLTDGLLVEAKGVGQCVLTQDSRIGMANFGQNGPNVQAVFVNN